MEGAYRTSKKKREPQLSIGGVLSVLVGQNNTAGYNTLALAELQQLPVSSSTNAVVGGGVTV